MGLGPETRPLSYRCPFIPKVRRIAEDPNPFFHASFQPDLQSSPICFFKVCACGSRTLPFEELHS